MYYAFIGKELRVSDERKPVSFRTDLETFRLLTALARKLGLSKAGVFALAIRRLAEKEGVG